MQLIFFSCFSSPLSSFCSSLLLLSFFFNLSVIIFTFLSLTTYLFVSVSDSRAGAAGGVPGGGPDSSQARFAASLPTYLPVQCQLSGADSAFFLREANQEVMRNGSLSSRTEPFFLHQLEAGVTAPQSLPSVNCSYGNLSAEQSVPVELLQGLPPHLLLTANQVTLNWKVKGQVVVPKVGSTRPWIQVLILCFILDLYWHYIKKKKKGFTCSNQTGCMIQSKSKKSEDFTN